MQGAVTLKRIARNPAFSVPILILVCFFLYLPGFFTIPPTDRDEARFAQASKQMIETGDFIDIRFQDEARHKKPVGIYWLQAAAAEAFGGADAPIWAYRLPSFFGALLATLATFWAAIPIIGRRAGFLAAIMVASCVLLGVEARIAKTDAMLLFMATLVLGAFARICLSDERRWGAVLLLWIAAAFGILLKGPIILGPLLGAMLWLGIGKRSFSFVRKTIPLLGLVIIALICAPWAFAIMERSDGAFMAVSLGEDLLGKMLSGVESHWAPPGAHIGAFLATFWPWTVLALFSFAAVWKRRRRSGYMLLLGWIVPFWLLLELTPTKLPHYPLPLFPAIAMLTGAALVKGFEMKSRPAGLRFWLPVLVWMIPAFGLPILAIAAPQMIEGQISFFAAIAAPFALLFALLAFLALRRWQVLRFVPMALISAMLTYWALFGGAIPSLRTGFIAPQLAATLDRCGNTQPVAVIGFREPSTIFLLGTDTLFATEAEAERLLDEGYSIWMTGDAAGRAFADVAPPRQAALRGFNYNGGDWLEFGLYSYADLACPPGI